MNEPEPVECPAREGFSRGIRIPSIPVSEADAAELLAANRRYQAQAESLLMGLSPLLQPLGEVHVTGSYALGLMVWADLDLYVPLEGVAMTQVYDLSQAVCRSFSPVWCEFKDARVLADGSPHGIFFGFETDEHASERWNVDVWFLPAAEIQRKAARLASWREALDDASRCRILALKTALRTDPGYGRDFGAAEIYAAVLGHQGT